MKSAKSVLDNIYKPARVTSKALNEICDLLNEVAPFTLGHHKGLRYDKWLIHTRGSEAPYYYVLARRPEGTTAYLEYSQAMTAGDLWTYIWGIIDMYEVVYIPTRRVAGRSMLELSKLHPIWFSNLTDDEEIVMYHNHLITYGNGWFPGVKLWRVTEDEDGRTLIRNVEPDHYKLGDTSFHSVQQAMEQAHRDDRSGYRRQDRS